ncbi:NF-X1-type zinc finger protein NFXL1 [Zea mays]|uniref:RING-type domain-containing protein n=2 Tax=Zea mays TaxID=4577 RepID=A0A804UB47_MAIZE|nr:NF-X1-type zinc finger protein NFXL1 [Zea mays]|eukprot:XP_008649308.1 NF-X1-type zinc finger protein NFXL1 [Zea mays]
MQPSTDRRRGGGPVVTASHVWRPRPAASAPGSILPLPTSASASASEARPPRRRPRRPNHGNSHNHRPAAPQEQNDNAGHRRRGPPPESPTPAPPARFCDRAPAPAAASTRGDGAVPQLVQEIQDKLSRGAVECMICYEMVRRSAAIWSCGSCFSIFHLPCIRKWVRYPASAADASRAAEPASPSWRCPGCQFVYATPARELTYSCFCGRRRDPPNDHFLTPHSCGEPCSKPLERAEPPGAKGEDVDATRCPHVCVLQCHPGPCPPCKAFAPDRPCPCGKQIIVRRCADRSTPVTCGRPCEQMLPCKRHRCEKVCHTGSCGDCAVLISVRCFCRNKNETLLCGDLMEKGELSEEDGVFSCNEVCGRTLACGNHACKDMCHPGPCGECELMPWKVSTCHCGKTRLLERRASCLDTIPTCDKICDKKLPCGVHKCKVNCHEGECPPCLVLVEQKCRCGSSGQMVECHKFSMEEFRCKKPCGLKKNCGRHRCSEICCPLSRKVAHLEGGNWDPHLCQISCGKKLRCGQHACQLLCHSGHCPPCLETIFTDLTCACGRTSLLPPLPCGTPTPSCPHQCSVPQPCGHPASHSCHFGDCPPCIVPVMRECIGGHVMLRNIPCGSKDIRCNQPCGKNRQCGIHACNRPCHPPPCDQTPANGDASSSSGGKAACGQVCGAARRECKHTCTAPCHPSSPCPDLRCEFAVTITCSCGRITATVPCGAGGSSMGDNMFEVSIIQKLSMPLQSVESNGRVPLGQRKLCCDEECAKMEKKRVLAEAFDITPPNLDALHFGENSSSSDLVSDLFRREPKWVLAIEERCKFLVLGKVRGSSSSNVKLHVFCPMMKDKRDAIRQIAGRWKLSVQSAGWEPKRFVTIHATPKSKPPARILGSKAGVPVTAAHPYFDPLVDMDPRLVVAMLDLPRDAGVSALVLRFGGECELVWLNDKNAIAVFNDPARAATALRRLDYGSAYQGAAMFMPSSAQASFSSNVWIGEQKDGGITARNNPWKKPASAAEPDPPSGDWTGVAGHAPAPGWRGVNTASQVMGTTNRWNVLESDAAASSGPGNERKPAPRMDTAYSAIPNVGNAGPSMTKLQPDAEVDHWEEACE